MWQYDAIYFIDIELNWQMYANKLKYNEDFLPYNECFYIVI